MQQVLFDIPGLGIPVYGFGAMLFVAAVAGTYWFTRRAWRAGLPADRAQDMAIVLFVSGLVGARLLYMIQYHAQFPDKSVPGLVLAFFQIWKGGIIFYGSLLGGFVGYLLFYRYVLRRMRVSGWQLADAVAPVLALGLAVGRVGCYLNGCCWGQVCVAEASTVPLGGAEFPLLPGHMRDQLVGQGVQTATGFAAVVRERAATGADPRTVVSAVEPGSPAAAAGLLAGDRVVGVDGHPNRIVVEVLGPADKVPAAVAALTKRDGRPEEAGPDRPPRVVYPDYAGYAEGLTAARREAAGATLTATDSLAEAVGNWPRGRHELALRVFRDGRELDLPAFVPRTVGLYPTQLYEVVSMVLLILFLLAYYPFRRHDGQLITICMAGYAVHRFVNESIRIEPAVGLGLTLSQWGSVLIGAAAVGLEAYLWWAMPSRWAAERVSETNNGEALIPGERGA